jgi:hypothetical protein
MVNSFTMFLILYIVYYRRAKRTCRTHALFGGQGGCLDRVNPARPDLGIVRKVVRRVSIILAVEISAFEQCQRGLKHASVVALE